jgi:glutaminase
MLARNSHAGAPHGRQESALHDSIPCPIQAYLERLHQRHVDNSEGTVATYIPELGKADPAWFGICIATADGKVYEIGDSRQQFTIQSISKPFTYGLAMEDVGRTKVLTKIGVEPTGDAFNSISLQPGSGRPLNPMINAGAIAAASLVAGHSPQDRFHRLLSTFSIYAGHTLNLDYAVYESERETGHRNRAIGHMLRNFDILTSEPEHPLDLYFRQCSISVDCRDLSVMAATLANGGVNPLTGERAARPETVEHVLSVMTTCGMYDYAGEWVYWVGMPAKSGVAGGVLAVLPGQLGVGVFSPRLDARGNSVRGVAVCRDLSDEFRLHFLRVPRSSRAALRAEYDLSAISSKRRRSKPERELLDHHGDRVKVYELQGDLAFAALETIVRMLVDASQSTDYAIIDLRRVARIDESAPVIFGELVTSFDVSNRRLVFVTGTTHSRFLRSLEEHLLKIESPARPLSFADLDLALEWCENRLLGKLDTNGNGAQKSLLLEQHGLTKGLTQRELDELESFLVRESFAQGELIIRHGDLPDKLYLLLKGRVSVTVALPTGQLKRLATLSPGMTFGELALIDRAPRSADVRADEPVECYSMALEVFDQFVETAPAIKIKILKNLLHNVSTMLTRLNQEVTNLIS